MEIDQWIIEDHIVHVSPSLEGDSWFASKVMNVGRTSFWITKPKKPNSPFAGPKGRIFRVRVPTADGLFQFACEVLAESPNGEPRIEMDFPKEVVHLERRAFPRLPLKLETLYAEIRDGGRGPSFSKSNSLDVSGGGIRLETNRVSPQETLLRVKFHIPIERVEQEWILTGRIVRCVPGEGARKSQVGVEFIDITPRQQESLVQYVLDRMQEYCAQAQIASHGIGAVDDSSSQTIDRPIGSQLPT
jgi:c-di-GMP-binding flagellar brake protein YcgR